MILLIPESRRIGSVTFDIHTLYYSGISVLVGAQLAFFWMFAKLYCIRERLLPPDSKFARLVNAVTLEAGLVVAGLLLAGGLYLGFYALNSWGAGAFGPISPTTTMRFVIPSGVAIMLAFQIASGTFFVSVLEIRSRFELRGMIENDRLPEG